jgi:flagellar biosynthesis GTPase FlhF
MTKRLSRESAKERKASEDMSDSGKSPKKKGRYNLRNKKSDDDGTLWVDDDTLEERTEEDKPKEIILNIILNRQNDEDDADDEDDEDYEEDEDYDPDEEDEDEDYDDEYIYEDEYIDEDEDEAFLEFVKSKFKKPLELSNQVFPSEQSPKKKRQPKEKQPVVPIKLSKIEEVFYKSQSVSRRKELFDAMTRISSLVLDEGQIPYKFKVLELPISDYMKSNVIKKITTLSEMCDNGESHKMKSWVDAFMKVPFGKTVPLPVQLLDGQQKCTDFMVNARKIMDEAVYGMVPAKTQIMQVIAQWIVNPESVGNVIALQGPMGVGKTSFARNAIAQVLQRPFEFFSLGGASDIANFVGHSYTYEGSTWGRIADSLMRCKVMNPVLYFDELDKVSGTPHGEEIISMLIHLTDRSQNTQFHDRYFSGVDFDMSQCLFVFSMNDIDRVHPILRDRMKIIHCDGYNEVDKKVILKDYIWNENLDRLKFDKTDLILKEDAIKYLITEFSDKEKGVRNLIRTVETMMTRLNMLRVANHESMKEYSFYMDVLFPLDITESVIKKLLNDSEKKESESWRLMYN